MKISFRSIYDRLHPICARRTAWKAINCCMLSAVNCVFWHFVSAANQWISQSFHSTNKRRQRKFFVHSCCEKLFSIISSCVSAIFCFVKRQLMVKRSDVRSFASWEMANQFILTLEKLKISIGAQDPKSASIAIDAITQFFDDIVSESEIGEHRFVKWLVFLANCMNCSPNHSWLFLFLRFANQQSIPGRWWTHWLPQTGHQIE